MAAKTITVTGPVSWAKIYQPDDKFGPPVWSINISLSKEVVDKIKKICSELEPKFSIKFIKRTDDGYELKAKRPLHKRSGDGDNEPPRVTDKDGNPFNKALGNGTVAKVTLYLYTWDNAFGKGWSADLNSVQVLTHIPYEADNVLDLSEEVYQPKKDEGVPFDDDIPFDL